MFSRKNQQPQILKFKQPYQNPFHKILNKFHPKETTSELIEPNQKESRVNLINSEPELPIIQEDQKGKQQNDKKGQHKPRFMRSTSNNKPNVMWKFLSPPAKINPLIHQPVSPKKVEEQQPYRRVVIPPSDLMHDKMKNFDSNPEQFFLNVNQGLQKVFKKSIQSIIRTAKVVPVKDWEIRDSTNLLDGFTGQQ